MTEKSFFSFGIRDKVTKWLNPDATQADLGEGMQAYYDEKLKVWVFPGEDPAEVSKPIGPPPTTPLAAPGPGPGPSSSAVVTATAAPSNDPLAAMMAPPKRGPPAGWQHKSKSAGAALGSASSTPLRPPMPGMVLMPGQGGGGAGGVQPPTFAVFTPPPAEAT